MKLKHIENNLLNEGYAKGNGVKFYFTHYPLYHYGGDNK